MGEVINLRKARKARDKVAREAEAAANRRLHGRTKAEKDQTRSDEERAARLLDGHRREPSGGTPPGEEP